MNKLTADYVTLNQNYATSWFWRLLPAGMRRRWWLFRLFDLISRNWPVFGSQKGLLIVRMDGIGDMVLFRGVLESYLETFSVKREDVIILGCKSWGSIAPQIYHGYRIVIIDEHAFARQPFYRLKISLMVRKLNVKTAVCDSYFRRAMMADSLVLISAAKEIIVSLPFINEPTRSEFTYYLSQANRVIDTGPYPTHEIVRHCNFLSALGNRSVKTLEPIVSWQENSLNQIHFDRYIVLNPGSNEYGRRWPYDKYLNIAEHMLTLGYRVVIVGGKGEKAGDHKERFGEDDRIKDISGKTQLPELMNVLKNAVITISNDTGPAHLSIALKTPTVIIVGGGHFGSFVPYPKDATPKGVKFVYEEMSCYHCFWRCHKRKDKFEVFPCVSSVTEEKVIENIMELIF
ncbi:MAG: glycosyltransferase family 9 protein [Pseudomonadota bacterium]|nr:glycosyltransferase family 9 protein [Pseudomonadota bacterium]